MFAIQLPVGKMIAVALLQASLLLSSLLPCPFPHPCHFQAAEALCSAGVLSSFKWYLFLLTLKTVAEIINDLQIKKKNNIKISPIHSASLHSPSNPIAFPVLCSWLRCNVWPCPSCLSSLILLKVQWLTSCPASSSAHTFPSTCEKWILLRVPSPAGASLVPGSHGRWTSMHQWPNPAGKHRPVRRGS